MTAVDAMFYCFVFFVIMCGVSLMGSFIRAFSKKEEWIWVSHNSKLSFVKGKYFGHGLYHVPKKDLELVEDEVYWGAIGADWGNNFGNKKAFILGSTAFRDKEQAIKVISKNMDREIKTWKDMFTNNIDTLNELERKYGEDNVV